jgi:hypothetical protein
MPSYSLRIDYDAVRRKVNAAVAKSPASRRAAYDLAYTYFIRAKNAMLRQFNEHPITEEIESGRNAVNLSGTLDGYGNLFSFIGFPSDERPVADLRALLQESVTFRQTIFRDMTFYFRVSVPDRQDVEAASQMPWEPGNSWAYEVERGISGANHYMYKKWLQGRSKTGVQIPVENMEDLTFSPKPYITEILQDFRDSINNIS